MSTLEPLIMIQTARLFTSPWMFHDLLFRHMPLIYILRILMSSLRFVAAGATDQLQDSMESRTYFTNSALRFGDGYGKF